MWRMRRLEAMAVKRSLEVGKATMTMDDGVTSIYDIY